MGASDEIEIDSNYVEKPESTDPKDLLLSIGKLESKIEMIKGTDYEQNKKISNLSEKIENSVREFSKLRDLIREISPGEISDILKVVKEKSAENRKSIEKNRKKIDELGKSARASKLYEEMSGMLDKMGSDLAKMEKEQDNVDEKVKQINSIKKELTEKLNHASGLSEIGPIKEKLDLLGRRVSEIAGRENVFSKRNSEMKKEISGIKKNLGRMKSDRKKLGESINELKKSDLSGVKELKRRMGETENELASLKEKAGKVDLSEMSREFDKSLDGIEKALLDMKKDHSRLTEKAGDVDEMGKRLGVMEKEIRKVSEKANKVSDITGLKKRVEGMGKRISGLKSRKDPAVKRLKESMKGKLEVLEKELKEEKKERSGISGKLRDFEKSRKKMEKRIKKFDSMESSLKGEKKGFRKMRTEASGEIKDFAKKEKKITRALSDIEKIGERAESFLDKMESLSVDRRITSLEKSFNSLNEITGKHEKFRKDLVASHSKLQDNLEDMITKMENSLDRRLTDLEGDYTKLRNYAAEVDRRSDAEAARKMISEVSARIKSMVYDIGTISRDIDSLKGTVDGLVPKVSNLEKFRKSIKNDVIGNQITGISEELASLRGETDSMRSGIRSVGQEIAEIKKERVERREKTDYEVESLRNSMKRIEDLHMENLFDHFGKVIASIRDRQNEFSARLSSLEGRGNVQSSGSAETSRRTPLVRKDADEMKRELGELLTEAVDNIDQGDMEMARVLHDHILTIYNKISPEMPESYSRRLYSVINEISERLEGSTR